MDKKITDIDQEIEKKIIDDRHKDYGNYQENFIMLADMFTIILANNLKTRIQLNENIANNKNCIPIKIMSAHRIACAPVTSVSYKK